ncbi:hypothetical protein [Psychrobacillus soli]|uniref:Uncharacterized protein n=1 Tax=Psychrobacillus soli TaxID=1543965 RepID=A0A544TLX8_9BACI|nr:hypothetical protein [Psychrobacillus soli]TQR18462.1 hypothetical protein FG383_00995 [Psychrobacillus soli]
MENLEIILTDINKRKVNNLIYNELKLSTLKVKSSHFYDNILKKDMGFAQVKNLEEILSPKGTGNIFLEELELGISLKNVVIVFSFDEEYGDIVFNFPESEILKDNMHENKISLKKLLEYLVNLKKNYDIPSVIIGYEPADEDTLIIEINNTIANYEKEIDKIIF